MIVDVGNASTINFHPWNHHNKTMTIERSEREAKVPKGILEKKIVFRLYHNFRPLYRFIFVPIGCHDGIDSFNCAVELLFRENHILFDQKSTSNCHFSAGNNRPNFSVP